MPKTTKPRPIMVWTPRAVRIFPSVAEASRETGITRQRLYRGLADRDGWIPRTRGRVQVDDLPEALVRELDKAAMLIEEEGEE